MYSLISPLVKLSAERILSPREFVRLIEKDRSSIESARFIPPKLGSDDISGYVRVVLKPGHKYATK
jgi:hypothetical protein